jgi:hypothetical protein
VGRAPASGQVRCLRPSLGRQLGVRLHLTRRNPLPWGPECPVHVPLLRPFTFTGQGLPWLLDGRFEYLTGLTWPYDEANAHAALENALSLVEQDPNLTSGQRATFENELAADIVSYATSGTPTYLAAQFAKAQSWARANRANTGEILVGEYGVAQPSHHALGARCRQARPGSPPFSRPCIAWALRRRSVLPMRTCFRRRRLRKKRRSLRSATPCEAVANHSPMLTISRLGPLQPCTSARPKVGATGRVIFRKGRLLGVDTDGFLTNYMVNEVNSLSRTRGLAEELVNKNALRSYCSANAQSLQHSLAQRDRSRSAAAPLSHGSRALIVAFPFSLGLWWAIWLTVSSLR